jgi:3-deoxy-manno-octulosonate cytidylyltransferase (CMP-KDO synthetase)
MRYIGIIPARMASKRLPGKPLKMICGKPMIQHVYERAKECLDIVYVATDHNEIFDTVVKFGGEAVMTPLICNSGTDRCYFAYRKIVKFIGVENDDIIINIQGDLPLLEEDHIKAVQWLGGYYNKDFMTTVAVQETRLAMDKYKALGNEAYVVFDKEHKALYFSRYQIPYGNKYYYKHIGIYAYSYEVLKQFISLDNSPLEECERLEQNRWLENGGEIIVGITNQNTVNVDTQEDLEHAEGIMKIINRHK